jgi:hypothetical protein
MDLGLGNLIELKKQVLPPVMQAQTAYDLLIQAIGIGVAKRFDKLANRKFARVVNDTCSFSADCDHFHLPRYPLESVSLIEQRDSIQTGWFTRDASTIMQMRESSGMIAFGGTLGSYFSTLRVTYTGGYWYDTSEDGSGTLPSGATKLPDDVKLAWYLQCRKVWQSIDKLGTKILQGESGPGTVTDSLAALEIVPDVKGILGGYMRYQMT